MQTIKTAAIVVLMLTVLYGGYVSLTTPPEPLPDEIADVLQIEEFGEDFLIEEDLSTELALTGPPSEIVPNEPPTALPDPQNAQPEGDPTATFGSSFADVPSADLGPNLGVAGAAAPPSIGMDMTDSGTAIGELTTRLPAAKPRTLPPAPAGVVQPNALASYGSTASRFEMPRPGADGSRDESIARAGGFPSTDTPQELRLTDRVNGDGGISSSGSGNDRGLINAFATADAMYAKGQLKDALATLSVFYGAPNLSPAQRNQLFGRLDPLAREVIYSRRHLLEQPHRVSASETLVQVAEQYDVPWQLLSKINGIDDPVTVLPGTELKMVRGPFRAEVDLSTKQLTLFLGDLYAGRFEVAVGSDPVPMPGTFTIQDKQTARVFYDGGGRAIEAGNPDNPYGNMWLDLGGQICIHGSPNTVQPTDQGCISIAGDLAEDVYGILGQGSSVTIRR
ncbi:MAG: L,D-transpeptidase family protein [Planctomycetota bacterium]